MTPAVEQFRAAIRATGIEPPEVIEPGKLQRFSTNGKRGDDAGWCRMFPDLAGGVFGDHRSGLYEVWQAQRERPLSTAEREAFRRRCEQERREREAEDAKRKTEAREKAAAIWKTARPAPDDHAYLLKKGVTAHGLRVHDGALVIQMRDTTGILHSLQFISRDEEKLFLPGGRVKGCYFSIGKPDGVLCIAEGYATGAAVHQATGYAVAIAFSAGNLESVATALRGKFPQARIVIAGDNDASGTGQRKAEEAARAIGARVAIPAEAGKDWNDIHREHGAHAVKAAIEGARLAEAPSAPSFDKSWPEPLNEAAYCGLAGEIVREIEPQTEADPAAILLQVLVSFGVLVGRGPHIPIEGDEHHGNLFALLVGETAKARKGTSWGRVREIFSKVTEWPSVVNGLSSGEGLKWAVRDPIRHMERDKKTGFSEEVETDPGVPDKRLLVVEPEFSQVLRQAARAGNTLSATIRCAWDTGTLRTLTRNDPVTSTGAHICVIGHITGDELRAELTQTDSANGFANRFLFMCVRRSQALAFGGQPLAPQLINNFAERIARAAGKARRLVAVGMTESAREAWEAVYPTLSEGYPGLFGAVTARAEAQCLRLALVFALMDETQQIDRPHLLAALAVWERAADSARHIFGAALGDLIADEILRALRVAGGAGLTRTAIRDLFRRHQTAERIGAALDLLSRRNLAHCEIQSTEGGRPPELWRCV